MSLPSTSPQNFSWSKPVRFGLLIAAGLLMGQSCSISIGSSPVQDGGVWRSDDGGQTWQQKVFVRREKNKTIQISDASILGFAFAPRDSQRIFIGTREQGVWWTANGGDQWQPTSLRSGGYRCLAFDADNPDIIYTAAGTTVLKSQDGGRQWQAVYNESQPNHSLTCVVTDPIQSREVWATTSGGKVLFSQDFGESWTLTQTLKPFIPRRLYLPPDGSGRLYIFSERNGIWLLRGRGGQLEDLSESLRPLPGALDIQAVTLVEGAVPRWYLGTGHGLLASTDDGASWQVIPTLVTPTSIAIAHVAARPNDPGEIFITVGKKLHHTVDGGKSWEVTNLPTTRIPTWLVLDRSNPDRLYFSTLKPVKK